MTTVDLTHEQPQKRLSNLWLILAFLVPISAIVLAIIEWSRGNTGRGLAFMATGFLGCVILSLALCGAAVNSVDQELDAYNACLDRAQTMAQELRC